MVRPYSVYCLKSRRLVGLLYRQFYNYADSNTLRQFYLSCIRPHLEYACTVWDPHPTKDITLLENVQKFACKICCKSWLMDYESMLTYLDIPSLQQRRLQLKANRMYQFVHGGSFILITSTPPSNYDMRTFSYFTVPFARTITYYNSFFPHMLHFWNSLPTSVVCAPSSYIVVCLGSCIVLAFAISWTMIVCRTLFKIKKKKSERNGMELRSKTARLNVRRIKETCWNISI